MDLDDFGDPDFRKIFIRGIKNYCNSFNCPNKYFRLTEDTDPEEIKKEFHKHHSEHCHVYRFLSKITPNIEPRLQDFQERYTCQYSGMNITIRPGTESSKPAPKMIESSPGRRKQETQQKPMIDEPEDELSREYIIKYRDD
jgi:hypothetical protein